MFEIIWYNVKFVVFYVQLLLFLVFSRIVRPRPQNYIVHS